MLVKLIVALKMVKNHCLRFLLISIIIAKRTSCLKSTGSNLRKNVSIRSKSLISTTARETQKIEKPIKNRLWYLKIYTPPKVSRKMSPKTY